MAYLIIQALALIGGVISGVVMGVLAVVGGVALSNSNNDLVAGAGIGLFVGVGVGGVICAIAFGKFSSNLII